jgi:hypothetical protein
MNKMPWLLVIRLPVWRRRVLTVYVTLSRS